MKKTLIYIGHDQHGYPEYVENMEDASYYGNYVDIDMSNDIFHPTGLHTTTPSMGEADCPVGFDFEVIRTPESVAFEIHYRVLDRLMTAFEWNYGHKIHDAIILEVAKEILENADVNWKEDDIKFAIGKVLCRRLCTDK